MELEESYNECLVDKSECLTNEAILERENNYINSELE